MGLNKVHAGRHLKIINLQLKISDYGKNSTCEQSLSMINPFEGAT